MGSAYQGGATPGQLVLRCIRNQVEQASKQPSSVASVSIPASKFLPCFSSCPDILSDELLPGIRNENTLSFPKMLSVRMFYRSNRKGS